MPFAKKKLAESVIDQAAERIIRVKNDFGILDKTNSARFSFMAEAIVGSRINRETLATYLRVQ